MRWYGDNSELSSVWDAKIPDILIFGGIAIKNNDIPKLSKIIEKHKGLYKPEAEFPIKYNMRDLKKWFKRHKLIDLYKIILKDSQAWRRSLIQDSLQIDYKIVVS